MMPVFAPFITSVPAPVNAPARATNPDPVPAPLQVSDDVLQFVLDDYQETVWYEGNQPCDPPDVLAQYWDEFIADCDTCGLSVPEGLNPEVYYRLWMDEYNNRVKGED